MFDFRLKVFYTTANYLSVSKAAEKLYISQPAATKHIQALEQYFQTKLFVRNGNKIKLTTQGKTLYKYTEQVIQVYKKLQFEMDQFSRQKSGTLRVGSSTTLTQYVLPQIIHSFQKEYPEIKLEIIDGNSQKIEESLLKNEIDLGIVEGHTKKKEFKYTPFLKDELVLVTTSKNIKAVKGEITLEELKNIPLVIREFGSGTLQVLQHYLKDIGMNLKTLNIQLTLGNTEAIKNYLKITNIFAFLSINSILRELTNKEFTIIEYPGPSIKRDFYFISTQGQEETPFYLFKNFVTQNASKLNQL